MSETLAELLSPQSTRWWGNDYEFTPALLDKKYGDGKRLLQLFPINERPRYWVVRVDSSFEDRSDEFFDMLGDIYEEIDEQFGCPPDSDLGTGDERPYFPMYDGEGTSWHLVYESEFREAPVASMPQRNFRERKIECYRCSSWPCVCRDGITLIQGDCRKVLPHINEDCALVLTDPPYGVTQQEWDEIDAVEDVILWSSLAVFTTGERLLAKLIQKFPHAYRYTWVWDRVNRYTDFLNSARRPMRIHELVAVFSDEAQIEFSPVMRPGFQVSRRTQGGTANGSYGSFSAARDVGVEKTELHPESIISVPGGKTNSQLHPTEKPVELFAYLLRTYPAAVTVDPFVGSGTTLVAAKQLNRRAIGIEINERYCEIAANRLRQEVLQFAD